MACYIRKQGSSIRLENTKITKCMSVAHLRTAVQNHNIRTGNVSIENVAKF